MRAAIFLVLAASCTVVCAQPTSTALSFNEAQQHLYAVSDALAASKADVSNKQLLSEASHALRLPQVTLDVRELRFRKTLELPLGSLAPVAESFGIPDPLRFAEEDNRLRPLVSAILPLYSGGQIPAAQSAAQAAADQASAELSLQTQSMLVELVQLYFGQQLAAAVADVRKEVRDGLQRHLDDTAHSERQGFVTKAQRLQVEVARDRAEREYQAALNDLATARTSLSILLRTDTEVAASTPLFVLSNPVATLPELQSEARTHPQLTRLRAGQRQSEAAVRAQEARLKPRIFAFGQYDLNRGDALINDPDWVLGIGFQYDLLSNSDRPRQIRAARAQQSRAEAGLREFEARISMAITKAYNDLDNARRQFALLDSSIAQTRENLRLQELSFREGQATSLDVIDARISVGRVQTERAQAAWQFEVALARLLDASGMTERFNEYLTRPDRIIAP